MEIVTIKEVIENPEKYIYCGGCKKIYDLSRESCIICQELNSKQIDEEMINYLQEVWGDNLDIEIEI